MKVVCDSNARPTLKNATLIQSGKKNSQAVSGLPLISKLDSDGESAPDAGSDEDINLDDDDDLGALNF